MKAFEFVGLREPPPKPRSKWVTEIRGPYYTVVTPTYLRELLEVAGDYVDIVKYAGGSMRLYDRRIVLEMNRAAHDYGVLVSTGGFTERVLVEGREAFEKYLEEAVALEFDVVEVSSGYIDISREDREEILKAIVEHGLKPKPEVSLVKGAGGGVEGWETESLDPSSMFREVEEYLSMGAWMVMIESEGITEGVRKWRTDIIRGLVERFGLENLMFEAAERPVFRWYVYEFGPEVNLFVDHSQILELTAIRTGLWAPKEPWGKVSLARGRGGEPMSI